MGLAGAVCLASLVAGPAYAAGAEGPADSAKAERPADPVGVGERVDATGVRDQADATAIVSGRVVDVASGRAVAGAVISSAGSAVAIPGASSPVRVMTNAAGRFVLRGVGAGTLVLIATKGGYVDARPGQRRPAGSGQPITVAAGARITSVEIRMWKCASIAGTVLDEAGDPAVNTEVRALRRTFAGGRARFVNSVSAVTDDRGMYRLAGLTPADYAVMVPSTQISVPTDVMDVFFGGPPQPDATRMQLSHEMGLVGSVIAPAGSGYTTRDGGQATTLPTGSLTSATVAGQGTVVYPTLYFPAATTLAQASIVTLRSGEERGGADMQIHPVPGVPVSGLLLGPEGPVATTAVRLLPGRDNDIAEPIAVATTMTNWEGAFTFPAVPTGLYELRVLRMPRPPPDVEGTPRISTTAAGTMTIAANPAAPPPRPPVPADATLVAVQPVAVGEGGIQDLIVPLSPGPRLTGHVEFVGTTDKPPAEAVSGMQILLEPIDGSPSFGPSAVMEAGRADGSGDFRTYGFPPGRYVLRVGAISAGWYLESAMFDGRDIADVPVDLQTRDATGVVITFTDRPSAITGRVSGASGAEPSAIVIVYPSDGTLWTTTPRRMRTARAGPDGAFAIQALPPGDYNVAAVLEDGIGEWQDPAVLQALAGVAQTVRLGEGDRKAVTLRAASVKR